MRERKSLVLTLKPVRRNDNKKRKREIGGGQMQETNTQQGMASTKTKY